MAVIEDGLAIRLVLLLRLIERLIGKADCISITFLYPVAKKGGINAMLWLPTRQSP